MSLMQLLAVGKSVEAASRDNPYKVVEPGALPKAETDSRGVSSDEGIVLRPGKVSSGILPLFETQAHDHPQAAAVPAELLPGRRWVLGRRKKEVLSAIPVARQRELALETLKVVRNDLRDADSELASRPKTPPEKQVEANPFTPAQIMPPKAAMPVWKRWPAQILQVLRGLLGQE